MKNVTRILTSLLLIFGAFNLNAQTTIINASGDGGFETGVDFTTNGWTVVNGTPVNRWVCSTGATIGFSGTRCAYITSNDAGVPPPHTYTNSTAAAVHLYRDVTFPSGETTITFSFSIRVTGESGFDRLLVYISNSTPSGPPTAGSPASSSTTLTGYTLLSTQATASTWTNRSVVISAAQAGNAASASNRRILFVWQNDGSLGSNPPVAIDNISLISSCLPPTTGLNATAITISSATLGWTAVGGATSYNVRYKKTSDPTSVSTWATPSNTATNSLAISGLDPGSVYEFQVSAVGVSCAAYTTSTTFTTLALPGCATSIVPANSATDIDNGTRFTWAAGTGTPTGYRLTFGSNSPNYDDIVNNMDLGNVLLYNTNYAFVNGTTYGFKIVPYNAAGSATGCSFNTFTANDNVRLLANGSITKCSGNFYDSGGSGSAYANSEDYTLTICPVSPTDKVTVNFSAFSTEAGYDGMMIYNGNSTAAPLISSGSAVGSNATTCPAGAYSGTTSPGSVSSSSVDGCLTFRFRSDVSGTSTGWTAAVSCTSPPSCPAPVSAAATLVTASSAQANWNLTTGNFIIEYGPTATFGTPGTGATANGSNMVVTATNTNLVTLTSLLSSTGYSYVVRQDCSGSSNGYSTNSSTITFTTLAAPPDCASGTVLSCGTNATVTTAIGVGAWDFAGTFPNNSCGFSTPGQERVFRFTPSATGTHTLVVNSGATGGYHDYFFKLASNGCSNTGWTCIGDVTTTGTTGVTFGPLTAGLEYYILVDRETSTTTGSQTFRIDCPVACPAPVAASATLITQTSAQANWNLTTGNFIIEYGPTATFGTPGTGATANGSNMVVTATNTNLVALTSLLASTGYSYVVRQDCSGSSNGYSANSLVITFTTQSPPPANDNAAGAIFLSQGTTCVNTSGSTANATQSLPGILCSGFTGNADDDVWYKFIATSPNPIITVSTTTDIVIQLLGPDATTNIACGDNNVTSPADETINATGLIPGETYYVRVYSYAASVPASFNICVYRSYTSVAGGVVGSCQPSSPFIIKSTGTGLWLYCVDGTGLVAAFKDDQNLGNVAIQYRTNATTRVIGGVTYVNRDITITPTFQPGGLVPVRLYYTNAELTTAGVTASALGCSKTPNLCGEAPVLDAILQQTGNGTVGSTGAYAEFNVSSFSTFYGASYLALPLELHSFTGKTQSTSNMLEWETLTEKNVQWHIVERSVDGIKWMEVGKKAGQLDSQAPVKYELEDRLPLAKAYYRLRSVDFDGQENLSSTIVLTRKGEAFGITAAFPSPTKDQITIQFAALREENVTIRITDVAGRLVLEQDFSADNGINEVPVQLTSLQAGVYLVRISNANLTAAPVRIIKE